MQIVRSVLCLFFILMAHRLFAQSVTLDMPKNADVKILLLLTNGMKVDTVFAGSLDGKGQLSVALPERYKDYKGIAAILPDRIGAYFEFIVAGEDVVLRCADEYPHAETVVFEGSPENKFLQTNFVDQAVRLQKIELLSELEGVYSLGKTKNEDFVLQLVNERSALEAEQGAFKTVLAESKLYAARFIELYNFLNIEVAGLMRADSVRLADTRHYVVNHLNMECLYSSGLWFNVINGLLAMYDVGGTYHYDFIKDMSCVLSRTGDKVYGVLAENLFEICEATGWSDHGEELAYFLINDSRIDDPDGKLKQLMTLFKLEKGSRAPMLSNGETLKNTVLIFHQTGCGSCSNEMQQLIANYSLLNERGYEVVSISADHDRTLFGNIAKSFPWHNKYCDGNGLDGVDFRNYGAIGTPTIYVIDNEGVIQGRYARLADTGIVD